MASTPAPSLSHRAASPPGRASDRALGARRHLAWLAAGLAGSFLVPFVFADRLGVPRDLYYGLYIAFAVGLFLAWARDTGQSVPRMCRRRAVWAVLLGLVFAAVMVAIAIGSESAGAHPSGLRFWAAIGWRGVLYGAADGLLLSAFPILVVFAAARARRTPRSAGRIVTTGALAMIASLAITATYHLGYPDFRSEKLRKPMTGDLVWSVPTLATLNPIGSPIAHAGLHVAAVAHDYETDLFLPPHTGD